MLLRARADSHAVPPSRPSTQSGRGWARRSVWSGAAATTESAEEPKLVAPDA